MLKVMREKSKTILWVVAVSFILFMVGVWGMDLQSANQQATMGTLGEVNGREIGVNEYRNEINTLVQNYRQQNQEAEPPEDVRRQFDDQAWQNLLQRAVLQREVEKRGLAATDKEVVSYIRSNPLPMFFQNPAFQTNGQFDVTKYHAALNDPRVDWTWLEDYVRGLLPFEKLRQEVMASVRVTDGEVRERFLGDQEQARVTYVAVSPRDFRDTTAVVTDSEIESYYREHADEFKRPESASLVYVLFEKAASQADEDEVLVRAKEILEEARGGGDFAEMARIYSEDTQTAASGGDLGFFGQGMMVPEFEAAAFALAPGAISDPVKTKFGYHIIKMEETRLAAGGTPEFHVRHILLKIEPSAESVAALYERAGNIAKDAQRKGFDKAVQEAGLTPTETTPFAKGDFVPGIGMLPRANAFAFGNPVGSTTTVIDGPRGLYVFNIKTRTPEGVPPLAEIKTAVHDRVMNERQRDAARARATEIANFVRGGRSLDDAIAQFSLEKRETPLFTRATTVGGVGRGTPFTYAAFSLQPGQTSGAIETNTGFYVLRVEERRPANETDFATRKEMIRQQIQQEKSESRFQEYVAGLLANAEITDRRALQIEG
ncbi:MAG: peptidylprolyl isomerase [bacterium]